MSEIDLSDISKAEMSGGCVPEKPNRSDRIFDIVRRFLGEFIGTGLLAFAVKRTHGYDFHTHGLMVGIMLIFDLWMCFPLSGSNVNPAFTLCLCLGRFSQFIWLPFYFVSQFLGALTGIAIGVLVNDHLRSPLEMPADYAPVPLPTPLIHVFVEITATTIFFLVVLCSIDSRRAHGWTGDGFRVCVLAGIVVYMLIILFGVISLNPAVNLANAIITNNYSNAIIGTLAPFGASFITPLLFQVIFNGDASVSRTIAWFKFKGFDQNSNYKRC